MNEGEARDALQEALEGTGVRAGLDSVDPETRMQDAFDLDSLGFLALVDQLHGSTGVEIPESDYGQIETVGELIRYLVEHGRRHR